MKRLLLVKLKWLLSAANTKTGAMYSLVKFSLFAAALFMVIQTSAQVSPAQQKADYKKLITGRADKIVSALSITDSVQYQAVLAIIADQYLALNTLQEENDQAVKAIKKDTADKNRQAPALKELEEKKSATLTQLHTAFIAQLNNHLTPAQSDKVKDGMTYNVFPITYKAYQEMIPSLTAVQKEKIYNWLKEARELAMDAGSSDKKHAVFGKYKGRINNYLSAEGYDVKKEGEEWAKRLQAAKEANQQLQ
jgi:Spy/CpxP family protein refolding chaperone